MPITKPTRDDKLTLLFYLFNRQMGAIADCLRHIQSEKQGTEYTDEMNGWLAHIRTELAATSAINRKMCGVLGINYDSTVLLGTIRDSEKMREYLERHPGAYWV